MTARWAGGGADRWLGLPHPSARRSGGARLAAQSAGRAHQPGGGRTWPPVGMAAASDRAAPESMDKGAPHRPPRQYHHRGGRVCHTAESRTSCPGHTGARGACHTLDRPRRCSLSCGRRPRCGRGLVLDPRHGGAVFRGRRSPRGGDGGRDGSRQAGDCGMARPAMAHDGLDSGVSLSSRSSVALRSSAQRAYMHNSWPLT
jgi:hypothetical protein